MATEERARIVTHEQALDAAFAFINEHFNNRDKRRVKTCIPRELDDDDVVLCDYIKQQQQLAVAPPSGETPALLTTAKEREAAAYAGEGLYAEGFNAGSWNNDFVARLAKDCIALAAAPQTGGWIATPWLDLDVLTQAADHLRQLGGGPMEDRLRQLDEALRGWLAVLPSPPGKETK